MGVPRGYFHAESVGDAGHGLPDAAESDDAEPLAEQFETVGTVPIALLDLHIKRSGVPGQFHEQRHGVLHYGDHAVAEHAMALAQAANRRICKAYIKVRNNNFALDGLLGQNFYGACAGIVGTGRIGAAMARICHGFGMNVLCYDMYKNPEVEKFARYVSLEELLQKADLVSLHCPLTEGTHHMINKDTIAMMRDSAILVNTSRGGLIDTDALIEALRARKFGGVGLDVYEDEDDQVFQDFSDDVLENEVVPVLLSFPNVVITSHQAFFTRTALQSIAAITLENARAFARGEELKNEVKA